MSIKQQINIAKVCAIINQNIICFITEYNKQYI